MDPKEKERIAQLGTDRRLAEAVDNLDLVAAEFTRIAGDENSTEEAVMQAASNYRAAVQRRNIAYDKSLGIPDDQAGRAAATITHTIDEDALKVQVEQLVRGIVGGDDPELQEILRKIVAPAETEQPPGDPNPNAGAGGRPAGAGGEASPPKSTEKPAVTEAKGGAGKGTSA